MSDRLAAKSGLSFVAIASSGLVRLVFSILVGRMFGSAALGNVNVLVSAAMFASLITSPGLGQAVAKELALRSSTGRDAVGAMLIRWTTMVHHLALALVAVALAAVLSGHGLLDRIMVALLTVSYGGYTYYKAVFYGIDAISAYVRLELCWDAIFLCTLLAVLYFQLPTFLLLPMTVLYLGFCISAHVRIWCPPASAANDGTRRRLVTFALITAIGTASSTGFLQLSMVFAGRVQTDNGAGAFAAAMALVTPAYLLPRALSTVLFPAMARAAGRADRRAVRKQLRVSTNALALTMLPGFVLVSMAASALLVAVYGGSFSSGGVTFVIMCWATWISIAGVPAVNALSSDKSLSYVIPAIMSALGFALGLTWWMVGPSTIEWVAWGYLAGSVLQAGVPMVVVWFKHRIPSLGQAARMVFVAGAGLAVSLVNTGSGLGAQLGWAVLAGLIAGICVWPEALSVKRSLNS